MEVHWRGWWRNEQLTDGGLKEWLKQWLTEGCQRRDWGSRFGERGMRDEGEDDVTQVRVDEEEGGVDLV